MFIVFRCEANEKIGNGHMIRSLSLAIALKKAGHQVAFVSANLLPNFKKYIGLNEFYKIDEDLNPSNLSGLKEISAISSCQSIDWLIVDSYLLDAAWESMARPLVKKIMVIDDLANRMHDCDLLLDQNIQNSLQPLYPELVPSTCQIALGLDYLLARESFYQHESRDADGTLVFLGGGDNHEALAGILNSLKNADISLPLKILVTSAYKELDAVMEAGKFIEPLLFFKDVEDTASLCRSVRMAIVRCGFIAYELALLGTPMLVIYSTRIQQEVACGLEQKGYAIAIHESKLNNHAYFHESLAQLSAKAPIPLNSILPYGPDQVVKLLERHRS